MSVKIAKWDTAEVLTTPERIAAYLDVALEDGDPDQMKIALGNIARSKGMSEIAEKAGVSRQSLYRALSPDGNPVFATVAGVLKALGLRLSVACETVNRGKLGKRLIKAAREGRAIARGEGDFVLRAAAAEVRTPVKSIGPRPSRRAVLKRTKRA